MKYRPDIDGLRAVAVVSVVLYHAGLPGLPGGFLGVDIFFVISGFLITSIVAEEIRHDRFSILDFYDRRARRILPALIVVVVASLVAGWFLLLPADLEALGEAGLSTGLFVSNLYFLRTIDYFSASAEFIPLLHTWSLAVEEQFYLFFPPLLALLAFWRLPRAGFIVVAAVTIVSLVASAVLQPDRPGWVFYLLPFRAWELGFGALLALGRLRAPDRRAVREALGVAGVVAIAVPMAATGGGIPQLQLASLMSVAGTATLIYVGLGRTCPSTAVGAILSHRWMVGIGLVSYSLYLWHWPLFAFSRILTGSEDLPALVATGAVAASFLLAWLSFRFVEQPFRSRRVPAIGRGRVLAGSAAALALLVAAGGALHVTHGAPGRLPVAVQRLAAVAADANPRRAECLGRRLEDGLCMMGATGDPGPASGGAADFIVWGDSHADALMPGIQRAAEAAGLHGRFAAHSACPPIKELRRAPEDPSCTQFNEAIWSYLQGRDDMPLIILAARWTLWVEGTRYGDEAGSSVELRWRGAYPRPADDAADATDNADAAGNAVLFEAGLAATVEALVGTGRRVVIVGPVPEAGIDVPRIAATNMLRGREASLRLSRTEFEKRTSQTIEILGRVSAKQPGVTVVPLADLFCDSSFCALQDGDGLPIYIDDDHVSRRAAERMLPPHLAAIWSDPDQDGATSD